MEGQLVKIKAPNRRKDKTAVAHYASIDLNNSISFFCIRLFKPDEDSSFIYGYTESDSGDVKINDEYLFRLGNYFWKPAAFFDLETGIFLLETELIENRNIINTSDNEILYGMESSQLSLDQHSDTVYTADETFTVSGSVKSRWTKVYVNDYEVDINRNSFSYEAALTEGFNLIQVEARDKFSNRTLAFYFLPVYRIAGDLEITIENGQGR